MPILSSVTFAVLAAFWSAEDTTHLLLKMAFAALCAANIYAVIRDKLRHDA